MSTQNNIPYNTELGPLLFREYGRHVQQLANYVCTIEDKDERSAAAAQVVKIMSYVQPKIKQIDGYKQKLWDDFFKMVGNDLDIDHPYPKPKIAEVIITPEHIPYPQAKFKARHYGRGVQLLINKAMSIDDKETRDEFAKAIAYHMRLVFTKFTPEKPSDEVIKNDLKTMSKGVLNVDDVNLSHFSMPDLQHERPADFHQNKNKGKKNKNKSRKKRSGNRKNYSKNR